jgi:glycosyltransferase involved in cell wall biosynthesis
MGVEKPRVVLMTADTVGGVWQYALELAAALAERGVRVALAAMGPAVSASQREEVSRLRGVSFHYRDYALEWMAEPWRDVERAGQWLLSLERSLAPGLVHLNQFAFGAAAFKAPVLIAAHSCVLSWWRAVHRTEAPEEWKRYRSVVREGLAHAARVVAPTHAMMATLHENYALRCPGTVIPNARAAQRYPAAAKEPVIFSAGRLWDEGKNVAALERVASHLPWPVRVAGSPITPAGTARALKNVVALGVLTGNEIADEVSRASIYALPARYEPFGLSVLEAALASCALVIGDIPSLREVWGRTALYAPPDDEHALRACLMRLIEDDALRRCLARAARARALTFTPERQAGAYVEAYCAAMAVPRTLRNTARTLFGPTESHACAS